MGFRVQGSGFRVQGLGFRVENLGFRVQGLQHYKSYRGHDNDMINPYAMADSLKPRSCACVLARSASVVHCHTHMFVQSYGPASYIVMADIGMAYIGHECRQLTWRLFFGDFRGMPTANAEG